jgi:hypothetical protein
MRLTLFFLKNGIADHPRPPQPLQRRGFLFVEQRAGFGCITKNVQWANTHGWANARTGVGEHVGSPLRQPTQNK